MSNTVLESVLTCPVCGHAKRETMATDACQFFYECECCKSVLRPKAQGLRSTFDARTSAHGGEQRFQRQRLRL